MHPTTSASLCLHPRHAQITAPSFSPRAAVYLSHYFTYFYASCIAICFSCLESDMPRRRRFRYVPTLHASFPGNPPAHSRSSSPLRCRTTDFCTFSLCSLTAVVHMRRRTALHSSDTRPALRLCSHTSCPDEAYLTRMHGLNTAPAIALIFNSSPNVMTCP